MGNLRAVSGGGPSSMDGFEVVFLDERGDQERAPLDEVRHHRFEDVKMVRRPPSYHGQRNFPGFYWAASNRRLLGYESRLEESNLTLLDQQPEVASLSTQPFWLHWEESSGKRRSHAPDVFVRYVDGTCRVIDVRTSARIERDRWRFETTAEACDAAGWGYQVLSEPEPTLLANVRWLAGYRRSSPFTAQHAPQVLELAADQVEFQDLVGDRGPVFRAAAFHLIWTADLTTDLSKQPLSHRSIVRRA